MTGFSPVGPRTRTTAPVVAGLLVVGLLAACGGGTTATPGASSSAGPTGSAGAGGRGGFGGMDMTAVRSCLEAAGVTMPAFPTNRPDFSRDPNFTGRPSFTRNPSFTARPTGTAFPGGGGRGRGFFLNDPKIRSALEACGITVPTFTPRARPSVPTASPSS